MNHRLSSLLQAGSDPIPAIGTLAGTEGSLHGIALADVDVLLLPVGFPVLGRSAQARSGNSDMVLFAISQIVSVAIELVHQHAFGIMPVTLPVPFNGGNEVRSFVECLEIKTLHPGVAIRQADVPHRPRVRAIKNLFDDQAADGDSHRMGRMSILYKQPGILFLQPIPRDDAHQLYPVVVRIQLAVWKYEILNF